MQKSASAPATVETAIVPVVQAQFEHLSQDLQVYYKQCVFKSVSKVHKLTTRIAKLESERKNKVPGSAAGNISTKEKAAAKQSLLTGENLEVLQLYTAMMKHDMELAILIKEIKALHMELARTKEVISSVIHDIEINPKYFPNAVNCSFTMWSLYVTSQMSDKATEQVMKETAETEDLKSPATKKAKKATTTTTTTKKRKAAATEMSGEGLASPNPSKKVIKVKIEAASAELPPASASASASANGCAPTPRFGSASASASATSSPIIRNLSSGSSQDDAIDLSNESDEGEDSLPNSDNLCLKL